jgi:hypothetical protein
MERLTITPSRLPVTLWMEIETIAMAATPAELRDLFQRRMIDSTDPELLVDVRYDAWEVWDAITRAAAIDKEQSR